MIIAFRSAIVALAILASPAQATVYDLAADFSSISNPNGPWSLTYAGGALLPHQSQPGPSPFNALNGASANGYWGPGPDFFTPPFIVQATTDGGTVGYTDTDFLTGDVLVHGPSDGSAVLINWIAPEEGTFDLSASFWYAHSIVTRSQDIAVTLDGVSLGSFFVIPGNDRASPDVLALSGVGVSAGQVLTFAFSKTAGQQFGALSGISAVVDFTAKTPPIAPVPEPASWALMIGGFALAGRALRGRKTRASFA